MTAGGRLVDKKGAALRFLRAALLSLLVAFAVKGLLKSLKVDEADALSWRLLGAAALALHEPKPGVPRAAVVLISDAYYESAFAQASPLDRAELARLVNAIGLAVGRAAPAVRGGAVPTVAIDLDLSPAARRTSEALSAQAALDKALVELAGKVPVAILCPLARGALRKAQIDWANDLWQTTSRLRAEGKGLYFARADVVVQGDAVLMYYPATLSVGVVAARLSGAPSRAGEPVEFPAPADLCAPTSIDDVVGRLAGRDASGSRPLKIHPAAYRSLFEVSVAGADEAAGLLASPSLDRAAAPLVFIGGGYAGAGDEYTTVLSERLPGAVVHAAVAYSHRDRVERTHGLVNLALQFGAVLLVLLAGHWLSNRVVKLMRPPPDDGSAAGSPVSFWTRILWEPAQHGTQRAMAEVWGRWLAGTLLMLVALGAAVVLFAVASHLFLRWCGQWFDFAVAALVAWLKVVAGESQHVMAALAQSRAADEQYGPPVGSAVAWTWAGIALRVPLLAYGALELVESVC